MLLRKETRTKSYNGNNSKGEIGEGVLGVLILHRRSEKNLVALFRLFLVSSGCVVLISGFACLLAFPFCGWGLAFFFFSGTSCFLIRLDFSAVSTLFIFCPVQCSKNLWSHLLYGYSFYVCIRRFLGTRLWLIFYFHFLVQSNPDSGILFFRVWLEFCS